jgi:biotin carboxyl carrier protein
MEYSLIAPRDGIIEEIFCKNGEQVTENSKLLNLEKIK